MSSTVVTVSLLVPFLAIVGCVEVDAPQPHDTQDIDGGQHDSDWGDENDEGGDLVGEDFCKMVPEGKVSLPADDGSHKDQIEWWYWTGHLRSEEGRWFGFEQVFFLMHYGNFTAQMANHAITDIDDGTFHYSVDQALFAPEAVTDGFDLAVGSLTASGGNGHDILHGEMEGYTMDLELDAVKPVVLQHGDGYTDYSSGGYTYYYSRERMDLQGTVVVDGNAIPVTGTAWFDHQWGDLQQTVGYGWDWFSIQLDDFREIMVFVLNIDGVQQLIGGSYTDADCMTTEIASSDFDFSSHGQWTSPHTNCTYPMGWTVNVNGMNLKITPVLEDQEVQTIAQTYWEGAATVSGDATGRAYVELSGYCKGRVRAPFNSILPH